MRKALMLTSALLVIAMQAVSVVSGADYYVSPSGSASWSQCTNINNPCSISTANSNVQAGDTVYLRGGTYQITGYGIHPAASGSSGNRITYAAYNGENVEFVGAGDISTCVYFGNGQSYITVKDITCESFYRHLWNVGGDYNEIASCTFSGMYDPNSINWRGSTLEDGCDYNWIHDCTFEKYGNFVESGGYYNDNGVVLEIGWDSGVSGEDNNVIEDCVFQYGGHHVIGIHGKNNIVRNNYFQNNNWINVGGTYYGNRVLHLMGQTGEDEQNLLENNRVAYGGPTAESDQTEGGGGLFSERWCIIRYNAFYQHDESAMFIHDHSAASDVVAEENYIYNNIFWYNGYDDTERWKGNWKPLYTHAVALSVPGGGEFTTTDDNVFKNNVFYQNDNEIDPDKPIWAEWGAADPTPVYNAQIYANNWIENIDGDPKFVDISGTPDPENPNQFDFSLQSGSGAIDGGTYMTQADGSGSGSTTLIVDDAKYFQDGWGNGAGGGAVVEADWIAIGTATNAVKISSINYGTNTITLSSPMTWSNGAPIWLYRKSDGEQVLYGSAPDQGAHEYSGSQTCTTHSSYSCYNGDVYWYNSCGAREELKEDCGTVTCSGGACQAASQYFLPEVLVEAESGMLSVPIQTGSNTSASGGQYIYASTSYQGSASFTFQIANAGKYRMEARVLSNNPDTAGANSFYVGLNSQQAQGNDTYTYDTLETSVFSWDNLSLRGPNGNVTWAEFDPMVWDLTAGLHTFTFYGREPNTWLDRIILRKACHRSDSSCDGCVSNTELTAFISLWYLDSSNPTLKELMEAIGLWKRGC